MNAPFEVNVSSKYGAPMGRRSDSEDKFIGREIQLRRVPAVDHDYDPGGAYWGGIEDRPLWCAWGYDADGDSIELYVRAEDRESAIALLPEECIVVQPKVSVTECPDAFFYAYVEAALWSSTDDNDLPLDAQYCFDDLDERSKEKMRADCDLFYAANADDIYLASDDQAGHDFWLTRTHSGVGFSDRDALYGEDQAERLNEAAKRFRECNLVVGDNGKVFCE